MVDMERARLYAEQTGGPPRGTAPPGALAAIPALPPRAGRQPAQLLSGDGVLLTGSDLEMVTVWYASLEARHRTDVLPLDPRLYTTDSLYRGQMAAAARRRPRPAGAPGAGRGRGTPAGLPDADADTAAVPFDDFAPRRMVRVNPADAAGSRPATPSASPS